MAEMWILVAHSGGARIFKRAHLNDQLTLHGKIEHPEGRKKNRDLGSDQPGRIFAPGVNRRHGFSSVNSPEEHALLQFAEKLSKILYLGRARNQFEHLVIVAAPAFAGMIIDTLDKQTANTIVGKLHRDFAWQSDHEVTQHLKEFLTSVDARLRLPRSA